MITNPRGYDHEKFVAALHEGLRRDVRAGNSRHVLKHMAKNQGIAFDQGLYEALRLGMDGDTSQVIRIPGMQMAMDAPVQSELAGVPNSGIPWYLANYVNPKVIEYLTAPMMFAQIAGERCVGIVDRLVLADHAAQLPRDVAGALLQHGVLQQLVGLHRPRRVRCERQP